MLDLQLDAVKDFDDNIEAFLFHMEAEDADLGAVLRTHKEENKRLYDAMAEVTTRRL